VIPPDREGTGRIVVRGLTRRFGERAVIDRLDLTVAPGEVVAVTGESGAGKSTLLNLLAGLDLPDAGSLRVDGEELAGLDDDARTLLRRRRIGFVFQAFHLLPWLDAAGNVALPLQLLDTPASGRSGRVTQMLAAVGLAGREHAPVATLSGGEQQRVAVARALVHEPGLVLADEPTGNLDAESAAAVLELLLTQIRSRGASGVLVTHSAQAASRCDRVCRLDHGRLLAVNAHDAT
jgi:putative ABC transport system ATP-binding protein